MVKKIQVTFMKKFFRFLLACIAVIWFAFSKEKDDNSSEFEKWLDK